MYTFNFQYSVPSIEVDDIESFNRSNGHFGTGSISYYVDGEDVVTVMSGDKAAQAIMRSLIENLSDEMRPK